MRIIYLICIAFFAVNGFAQSVSVYGLTIDDYSFEVESILEEKGKKVGSGTTKLGFDYLEISKPTVYGVTFNRGFFRFGNDDKLQFISFSSQLPLGYGTPGASWEAEFHRTAKSYQNAFLSLYQTLRSIYGTPDTAVNQKVTWIIGDCEIILEYRYKYEYEYYSIVHSTDLFLSYNKIK